MSEKPKFVPVDLTELMDEGVLMAANERFFWPLGLALTWDVPTHAVDEAHWCGNDRVHEAHTDEGADWHGECGGTALGTTASNLHVREWQWEDEHHEGIEIEADDPVVAERRARFEKWWLARIESMPPKERRRAVIAVSRS